MKIVSGLSESGVKSTQGLGPSQRAVLDYVTRHPGETSNTIGEALYDEWSTCSHHPVKTLAGYKPRQRSWASRILSTLQKRGLVTTMEKQVVETGRNRKFWYLTFP